MAAAHRLYARALFQAAQGQGKLTDVHAELGRFAAALEASPELRGVLANPQLETAAKLNVLSDILGGGDELVRNFVLLLAEKGRVGQIEEIYAELERLVAREQGRLAVELTTAYELSDEEAESIVRTIEQASGRKVEAARKVDARLIGGIVLQAGSLRVDASVRGRLNQLRHELVTRT